MVSWGGNRLDAFARGPRNQLLHWYFADGWHAPQDLGGLITSAPTVVSLASGSLDVLARGAHDALYRNRFALHWSSWTKVGGIITAAPGASADRASQRTTVIVRGTGGSAHLAILTYSHGVRLRQVGLPAMVVARAGRLHLSWCSAVRSGHLLRRLGGAHPQWLRRYVAGIFTGAPGLVMTGATTFVMVGRSPGGTVFSYEGRPGAYTLTSLGGHAT
ncbi:MAG: hypothetical protein ACR2KJ_18135 [Jatrophihabitans sp.]